MTGIQNSENNLMEARSVIVRGTKKYVSQREFNEAMRKVVEPIGLVNLATRQYLSHGGLCVRGGVVEKLLTRAGLIK